MEDWVDSFPWSSNDRRPSTGVVTHACMDMRHTTPVKLPEKQNQKRERAYHLCHVSLAGSSYWQASDRSTKYVNRVIIKGRALWFVNIGSQSTSAETTRTRSLALRSCLLQNKCTVSTTWHNNIIPDGRNHTNKMLQGFGPIALNIS